MQTDDNMTHRCWNFIEEADIGTPQTAAEQVYFREIAAAYLRATFTPPDGYVIDVLEAQHQSKFPVIALGWNEPEPLGVNERREFIRRMVEPLNRFCRAVDWHEVARIRAYIKDVPGLEDLKSLLKQHDTIPVVHRCLEAFACPTAAIRLEASPKSAITMYNTHVRRSYPEQPGSVVEHSTPFLPALKKMIDADERISVHRIDTRAEDFFIITDAYIHHLVYIKGMSPSFGLYLRPKEQQPDAE